jgi:spermidine synthase
MDDSTRAPIWPGLLFVASGAAALVLEAVFLRQLAWLFGNSATATALVLSAFMAGLAIGAASFGKLADRVARPLRLFGLLELGTAVSGASLAWLLGSGRGLFLAPLRLLDPDLLQRIVELVLAFGLVLIPTILMGGTLPALSRFVIRRMDRFLGRLGLLYGLNTLGAAIGVFVAGFYLFELVGVSRSAYLAAAVQIGVGATALLIDRFTRGRAGDPRPVPDEAEESTSHEPPPEASTRLACLLAAAVGGLAVLGYEVVWTRLLSLPMRSFSYSFSLMLALFLLGLCIGAVLLWLVGGRVAHAARWVGWMQIAMGLYVATSLFWLPGRLAPVGASSFEGFLMSSVLRAAPIVLPPTILSGMVLPLAARGYSSSRRRVGAEVGLVYGLNTAGAILGALAAGLVLLPWLGAPKALAVLALSNAAVGALVLTQQKGRSLHALAGVLLAAGCAVPLLAVDTQRFVEAFLGATRSAERIGELLFFHEGSTDTVAIVRKQYGFHDPHAKSLITNGIAMSATVKPVWRYMAQEGHLPVLLARSPRRALAIGVGTGITLGAVTSHPEVESIVAIELSEGVMRGLPVFERENGRAFEDPRVQLRREDGRHYLELTEESFDVITLEPPPPIVAGSVHLYSRDFYDLCLEHLDDGGIVAQWLPLHAQSLASARMTARTFLDAFPHVMLWLPSVRDAVLIGAREGLQLDLQRLIAAYADPTVSTNLDAAFLETPEAFLGTYLLDRDGIEAWAGDAPVITDDRPLMEFFRHQGGNMSDRDIASLLAPSQAGWSWVRGMADEPGLAERVRRENRALRLYTREVAEGAAGARIAAARSSRGTEFFLYGFGCATSQLDTLRAAADMTPERLRSHVARCDQLRAQGDLSGGGEVEHDGT